MTYQESKKIIDDLRRKNEMIFRMAISHLMDVGIKNLTEELVESTCKEILQKDDTHSFMTNEFQCDLIHLSMELAKIDHLHLLVYIQNEVFYNVGQTEITRDRAIELLEKCIDWMSEYGTYETSTLRDALLDCCGFEPCEIKQLGFEYVLPTNWDKEGDEEND